MLLAYDGSPKEKSAVYCHVPASRYDKDLSVVACGSKMRPKDNKSYRDAVEYYLGLTA